MQILIVDDHPHVCRGTAMALRELVATAHILEAGSIADAHAILQAEHIDLVLLDLSLPDCGGIDTLRALRVHCEVTGQCPRIVIVSGTENVELIDLVLSEHGTGFIPKGVSAEIFKTAIGLTLAGGVYIPEMYLRARQPRSLPASNGKGPDAGGARLTDTERLVAAYCVQGLTYKQIARAISQRRGREMSDLTVKTHVKNTAIKLGIQGEGKAAVVAQIGRLDLRFPLADGA